MKIYIASSWKNQHAVEMLTEILEFRGHALISFVRAAVEAEGRDTKFDLDSWIASDNGFDKFLYDLRGATQSDLVIYIGPSGTDAWAEVGAAYQAGVPIFGLYSKGEQSGLMRLMVRWFRDYQELLSALEEIAP